MRCVRLALAWAASARSERLEVRAHFLVRGLWGWLRFVSSANADSKGEKRMRRALVAVICAMAFAGFIASSALAGEVTGPPGSASNPPTNATGAPEHSNSICSFNGLNDFNQGPTVERTQTPHNQGVPGQAGADAAGSATPGHPRCGGGSNTSRGIPR